jgi:hypothetical protein
MIPTYQSNILNSRRTVKIGPPQLIIKESNLLIQHSNIKKIKIICCKTSNNIKDRERGTSTKIKTLNSQIVELFRTSRKVKISIIRIRKIFSNSSSKHSNSYNSHHSFISNNNRSICRVKYLINYNNNLQCCLPHLSNNYSLLLIKT